LEEAPIGIAGPVTQDVNKIAHRRVVVSLIQYVQIEKWISHGFILSGLKNQREKIPL
jgi:hypothetical protein